MQQNCIELSIVLARILVCKPNSTDFERLVIAYNTLKTASRDELHRDTISHYLYININMPALSKFNPRPAVNMFINEKCRIIGDTTKADKQSRFKRFFKMRKRKQMRSKKKEKQ